MNNTEHKIANILASIMIGAFFYLVIIAMISYIYWSIPSPSTFYIIGRVSILVSIFTLIYLYIKGRGGNKVKDNLRDLNRDMRGDN